MNTYWIDFNGYCRVRAQTEDQAIELAFRQITFHNTADIDNFVFDIEGVEPCGSEDEVNE